MLALVLTGILVTTQNGTELARVSRAHGTAQLAVYDQGAFYVAFKQGDDGEIDVRPHKGLESSVVR